MADTKLKKVVKNLAKPTRSGNSVHAEWEVPAACLKDGAKDDARFDGQDVLWVFDAKPANKGHKKNKGDVLSRDATNKDKKHQDTETIPRKRFFPLDGMPNLVTAECWVRGYNFQGSGQDRHRVYGKWEHRALKFEPPDAPTLALSYDDTTNVASMTYTAQHPNGAKECYDTKYWFTVGGTKVKDGETSTKVTQTFTRELPGGRSLGIGVFRKITAKARNRGFAGRSKTDATKSLYVCHPNPPVCGTPALVHADADNPDLSTAMVRVPVSAEGVVMDGKTAIRPSVLRLERLKNSESATDVAGAASASGWQTVTTDNGTCKGLADTWANAVSQSGKFTWYRLVAIRDGYETQGVPVQAACLDVHASGTYTGRAKIDSAVSGADGRSAILTLSGKGASDNGYEVTWSAAIDAWQSTDPPDMFETTSSTLVVKGLDEGVQYYFKARAYRFTADGSYIYGDYSDMVNVTPFSTPSTVVLNGPGTTPRGSDMLLTWTYDTETPQRSWRLVDADGTALFSGEGATCARLVKPDEYGDASSLSLRVEMTTDGSNWARSGLVAFNIADPPTISLTAPATITAQPISFTVASDTGDAVYAVLSAQGSSGTGLHGDPQQFEGDTVWSGTFNPLWAESGGTRSATVELPAGLALFDGAAYMLAVTANDGATGLDSATAAAEMKVDWSHKAQQPTGTVEVDAEARTATVTVAAPEDYATGDRFDLYRVTTDGERRIASNQPFGTSITDRLAPFTHDGRNLAYMAVTRTADGASCASDDIGYELACASLRLDWGPDYIELPYDLSLSDEMGKNSEVRTHMDGTRQAYWDEGCTRKASITTDLVRFEDAAERGLLSGMLQYAGSVFVRTPDGLAYAADVQPGTVSRSHKSAVEQVSLTAVEHDLTDEGRPDKADISEPAWNGGAVYARNGVVYDGEGDFPMDDWAFIGYASSTLYVADSENAVRDGDGDEMQDWTFDGLALYDDNGDEVEVTEEPTEE